MRLFTVSWLPRSSPIVRTTMALAAALFFAGDFVALARKWLRRVFVPAPRPPWCEPPDPWSPVGTLSTSCWYQCGPTAFSSLA